MLGGIGYTVLPPQLHAGWELIDSFVAHPGHLPSACDFKRGFDGSFDKLKIEFADYAPNTATRDLCLQVWSAGAVKSGAADYEYVNTSQLASSGTAATGGSTGATSMVLTNEPTSGVGIEGEIIFSMPTLAGFRGFRWEVWELDPLGTGKSIITRGGGRYVTSTNPIEGLRLLASTGNLSRLRAWMYGLRRPWA